MTPRPPARYARRHDAILLPRRRPPAWFSSRRRPTARPPEAETPAPPDRPRPVVLLLDDYKLVSGTFALDARGNYVRAGDATQVYEAKRVLFVGASAPEVRAFLAARAKEPAATAAKPPAGDFNAVAAAAFPTRVQPLLTNLCAGCHAKPDYAGAFKLRPIPPGHADADAARANLAAAFVHLRRDDPSASDLLAKAVTAHGGQKAAALPRPSHPAYRTLELWAHGLMTADGTALPTVVPPAKLGPPPRRLRQPAAGRRREAGRPRRSRPTRSTRRSSTRRSGRPSRQQLLDDVAMNAGQPHVEALRAERQLRVVEAEQVQQRGVQVVDVDLVLDGVEPEVVRPCRRSSPP